MKKTIHFSSGKPSSCPECDASPVATILWGLPSYTPEVIEGFRNGTLTTGGCCVTGTEPVWKCGACGAEIYDEADRAKFGNA